MANSAYIMLQIFGASNLTKATRSRPISVTGTSSFDPGGQHHRRGSNGSSCGCCTTGPRYRRTATACSIVDVGSHARHPV